MTLLTAILWVGLNIYRSFTIKPAVSVPENISKPINPTLDTETIQKIQSAIYIPDSEVPPINMEGLRTSPSVATATPTIAPIITPIATPASEEVESTESGIITN